MGSTALVHPRTARLTPEEQAKGNYEYISPEELQAMRESKPALADQNQVCWACIEKDDRFEHTCKPERSTTMPPAMAAPYGKKLVSKAKPAPQVGTSHTVQHAVFDLLAVLPDERAYAVLAHLANRFDMEFE
ncbi:hypothetical protein BN110_024 [Yersinia phage phiR8-01]|uniref:Uncharacterized protein n=1 Tax=Yersinia phage phiR8-01 TaxID=1206556 RepID=I7KQP8_9CAUD|nr:hypothetical protein HOT05_gp13 [Yersinia phage phiR8-01]CCI88405.1 hypothetical protein BN110_024 [Yersinia phage phiR8-01]